MLTDRDCANFVQDLINQVAKDNPANPSIADYVPDLLDDISFIFAQQYDSKGGRVAGKALARDTAGHATFGISPLFEEEGTTPFGRMLNQYEYIETALHEVIHLAGSNGRYTDRQLAQAAVNLGGLPKGAAEYYKTIDPTDVHRNSGFFDSILQNHCVGPNGKPTF